MTRKRRKLIVRDRRKTALRTAITALVLLAIAGLAVLAYFIIKNYGVSMSVRELPMRSGDIVSGAGSGVMFLRGDTLRFISFEDEDKDFQKTLTGNSDPTGLAGTDGVRVVWSESAVQIIGSNFDIYPEGTIVTVRCSATHLAVCTRLPSGKECLYVYTSSGQQIKTFTFGSGRLMDFGFSEASGSTLWTMELDTDSGSPRTTVSTFDLSRMSSTGVITVSGQLVERLYFTNSSVFVIGTESLIRYSSSANREIYRVQLYGYRAADITLAGDSPMLMLIPRDVSSITEAASIRLLTVSQKDVADETAVTVTLPEDTVGCHLVNGKLAVVSESSVKLYSGAGKLLETDKGTASGSVSSQKLDEHHILLERSGEFDLLTVGK